MDKFWNWVRNEADEGISEERTLFLTGEISDVTWYGDEVTPQIFRDELESGTGDIRVIISSPGGDVFAASTIYNLLRDYKGHVHVVIDSLAASAASVIAMSGDKISISPVGMYMIHNPMMCAGGNQQDLEKAIEVLSEVKESIINAYMFRTGLSHKKISEMMDNETWMNARKAVELGFADEILFESGTEPKDKQDNTENDDEPQDKNPKAFIMPYYPKDVLFSRKAVEDSFLSKVKVTDKSHENMTPISQLDKRLSLLSH